MDYLIARHMENKRLYLFLVSLSFCLLFSCNKPAVINSQEANALFQPSNIPAGKLELQFIFDNTLYNLSLQDTVFKYETEAEKVISVLGRGNTIQNITFGDVESFLSDSSLVEWQIKVLRDGRLIKGEMSNRIKNYLIALLLQYSPIVPDFNYYKRRYVTSLYEENPYYKYEQPISWNSIELCIGGDTGNFDFYFNQSLTISQNTLEVYQWGDSSLFPIEKNVSDSISQMLRRIDVNTSVYYGWPANDLYGYQIYVDKKLIFQTYPSCLEYDIEKVPYRDLIKYIESLCPLRLEYVYP